jgi:hypothetical protein
MVRAEGGTSGVGALAFLTLNPVAANLSNCPLARRVTNSQSPLTSLLQRSVVLMAALSLSDVIRSDGARCATAQPRSPGAFSPKFIFRASPSDRAGRYFRGTRAHDPDFFVVYETDSGRLAPSPGALPFARTRPARSARSSHTALPFLARAAIVAVAAVAAAVARRGLVAAPGAKRPAGRARRCSSSWRASTCTRCSRGGWRPRAQHARHLHLP